VNTTIIHDERCIARIARQQAFDLLWPRHCKHCLAWGGQTYRYDPSPPGISLCAGIMEDFDPCPECIERGICPRCAQPISGPKWQPINLRERVSYQLFGLARMLEHARPDEWLLRQAWWRGAALFRENPTAGTWTIYHPIDKLWNYIYDKYSRPRRASRAVFAVQAWLERGVYDERPCYHCGWNWGKHADDGRELGDCECWIPGWEEEQDKAGIPLVQA